MWYPQTYVPLTELAPLPCGYGFPTAKWHVVSPQQFAANEIAVFQNFLHIFEGFHHESPYTDSERKLSLMRSLFNHIWENKYYLELSSPTLLGWFLSLTAEEKALINREGGPLSFLKKHPGLGVTRQYVYVKSRLCDLPPLTTMSSDKYPTCYGTTQCQNCMASYSFGSKSCLCGVHTMVPNKQVCISEDQKKLELLPNCVKVELSVPTGQQVRMQHINRNSTEQAQNIQRCDNKSLGVDPPSYNNDNGSHAQCLSQLWQKVDNADAKYFRDTSAQASFSLDLELDAQSKGDGTCQINPNASSDQMEDSDRVDLETTPQYYSFSSTSLNFSVCSDGRLSEEASYNESLMATKGSSCMSNELSGVPTAADSSESFSCLGSSLEQAKLSGKLGEFEQQIMETNLGSSQKSRYISSAFVDQMVDATGDFRAFFTTSRATEIGQGIRVNVATETEFLVVNYEKESQTLQNAKSDKSTITEMTKIDLDVLTEDFMKLKEIEKKWKQMKNTQPSPDDGDSRRNCASTKRVPNAELRVLALEFVMCQQHCLRCYFGERALDSSESLPDSVAKTLKTLEMNYHEMRRKILEGTPLDDLEPLSVISEKIATGTLYSPASIVKAHFDSFGCLESAQAQEDDGELQKKSEARENVPFHSETALDKANVGSKGDAAKDLNATEAWFDAEEEIVSPHQDGKIEKMYTKTEKVNYKMEKKGIDGTNFNQSSLVSVTHLPDSATESDVLRWFQKYNATNACFSTLSNNTRTAVVYLRSPSDAKAAVEDLKGQSLNGQKVQVVHLCHPAPADRAAGDSFQSGACKMETEKDELRTKTHTLSSSPKELRCSIERLINASDSPTASGTYVPQHFPSLGSFAKIMARLTKQHPNISRQQIIDALLELRSKHKGYLSGLSLQSIVDMTSELLSEK